MSGGNRKIRGCGFHHISLKVKDLETSLEFYEALGFTPRYIWGEHPRRTVLMDTGDGNYFEVSQGDPDESHAEGVYRHLALRVDDCEAAVEVARRAGAEVTVEPRDVTLSSEPPLEIRIAFFKGPDGELIEFFEDEQT